MIYKPYGTTGVEVSTIGFGGMRFANMDDTDTCAALIHSAYQKGITYFDTAPGYGKSEDLYGVAFREMRKTRADKPFYIATKTMKSEPSDIREQLETSLKRMDVDYVDFYHVWCVYTLDDYNSRKAKGAIKEFERLKAEGLVKHICISTHAEGKDIGVMLDDYPFAGVLLGYSVMNFPFRDMGLDAAAKLKRGVVVMNPLGGGIIPQHPDIFSFVKTQGNESVVDGALRFLINDPRITVSLVGFADEQQLDDAIQAVDGYRPFSAETTRQIRSSLEGAFNEMCTGCTYCDHCPEGIPVPMMMDGYNQYMLSSDPNKMLMRMKWHWGMNADDERYKICTQCGTCEDLCTQSLPIIERLEFMRVEAERYLAEQASD